MDARGVQIGPLVVLDGVKMLNGSRMAISKNTVAGSRYPNNDEMVDRRECQSANLPAKEF